MGLNLENLARAIESLDRAVKVATDEQRMRALDADQRETIRAGVIQNFEFTYDQCWKMLKRQLETMTSSNDEVDHLSFRELARMGAEKGIISDPTRWFLWREQRNITSHTYDPDSAGSVFKSAVAFYEDARALLLQLELKNPHD